MIISSDRHADDDEYADAHRHDDAEIHTRLIGGANIASGRDEIIVALTKLIAAFIHLRLDGLMAAKSSSRHFSVAISSAEAACHRPTASLFVRSCADTITVIHREADIARHADDRDDCDENGRRSCSRAVK